MKAFTYKYSKLFLLLAAIIFVGGCQEDETSKAAAQAAAAEAAAQSKKPVMRILFVGNDYTSSHNMPYILQSLAQNDPSAHFSVEVGVHALPDTSLAQLWKDPNRANVMAQSHWDYVILQPHHMWASSEGSVYLTQKSINAWKRLISEIDAMPVFFMTWPLEKNNLKYADINQPNLKNYRNMHRLIRGYSKAIAKKSNMLLLPIGDYWMHANNKGVNLYLSGNPDAPQTKSISEGMADSLTNSFNHAITPHSNNTSNTLAAKDFGKVEGSALPSIEGSYLNALIIYKMLVDSSINDIEYIPAGITPETKTKLLSIASSKIKEQNQEQKKK